MNRFRIDHLTTMELIANPEERVLLTLAQGLLPDAFEIFRVKIYDSGAEDSLKELSLEQVHAIGAALLPDVPDALRYERLTHGLEIREAEWILLRVTFA